MGPNGTPKKTEQKAKKKREPLRAWRKDGEAKKRAKTDPFATAIVVTVPEARPKLSNKLDAMLGGEKIGGSKNEQTVEALNTPEIIQHTHSRSGYFVQEIKSGAMNHTNPLFGISPSQSVSLSPCKEPVALDEESMKKVLGHCGDQEVTVGNIIKFLQGRATRAEEALKQEQEKKEAIVKLVQVHLAESAEPLSASIAKGEAKVSVCAAGMMALKTMVESQSQ